MLWGIPASLLSKWMVTEVPETFRLLEVNAVPWAVSVTGPGVPPPAWPPAGAAVTVAVPVMVWGWTSQWKKYVPGLGALNDQVAEEPPATRSGARNRTGA